MRNPWLGRPLLIAVLVLLSATLIRMSCLSDTMPVRISVRCSVSLQTSEGTEPVPGTIPVEFFAQPCSRKGSYLFRNSGYQAGTVETDANGVAVWTPAEPIYLMVTSSKDPDFQEGIYIYAKARYAGFTGSGYTHDWPQDPDSELTREVPLKVTVVASK